MTYIFLIWGVGLALYAMGDDMRRLRLGIAYLLLLSGCVNSGSPQLLACLEDPRVMPQFMASTNEHRALIGGMGRDGVAEPCVVDRVGRLDRGLECS